MPKKKKKDMSAQELLDEITEEEEAKEEPVEPKMERQVKKAVKSPEDIESLRAEVQRLEMQQAQSKEMIAKNQERNALKKRIKELKFKKSALGKFTEAGKVVFGRLGKATSQTLGGVGKAMTPKQAVQQKQMVRQAPQPQPQRKVASFEDTMAQVNNIANFGMSPPAKKKKGKKKGAKPMDMNAFINSLPQ